MTQPDDVIRLDDVTKYLGGRPVLDGVNFGCPRGTVTGFLGLNGAGKTTTMRLLTGLLQPDGGSVQVLGGAYRSLPNPGRRVGVLLDASAQHAGRRGREALLVSAQVLGVPTERVDALLAQVGLDDDAAGKRVRDYSLGMRQRLGLAHALLGEPELLILDEPANGLDPAGMRWMRALLREFVESGGTVLLSSHLLHEVEAVADRLVIIGDGRIAAAGRREELLAGSATLVRARDEAALAAALCGAGLVSTEGSAGGRLVDASAEQVGAALLRAGVAVTHLSTSDGAGLEQLFATLTEHGPLVGAGR